MKEVVIADRPVGPDRDCYVIAELGAMYEDLAGMKELITVSTTDVELLAWMVLKTR